MASMFPSERRFVSQSLAVYMMVRFAYLLEWWIFQDGLERPYVTMHHVATSILLCCAVFAGWTQIGSIIAFLHDLANVPLQVLVWTNQMRVPTAVMIVAYLSAVFLWVYLLLYSFFVEVVLASVTEE